MGRARKAVAGMLAFMIGISIVIVALVPLLLLLNSQSSEMLRAANTVNTFQSLRDSESLNIVIQSGDIVLKNTGSVPITIALLIINNSITGSCIDTPQLVRTNTTISPGDYYKNITVAGKTYKLEDICYIVTTRGNVIPIKEKYYTYLSQLSGVSGGILSRENTRFAEDMNTGVIKANYSTNDYSCNIKATPYIAKIPQYPNRLLTANDSNDIIVFSLSSGGKGCLSFTFENSLELDGSGYAVLVVYRIVVVGSNLNKNNFRLDLETRASVSGSGGAYSSSATSPNWQPKLDSDYLNLTWDVILVIPMKGASPGRYSLTITIILNQINSNGNYRVGVEYLSVQGMRLLV